MMRRMIQAGLVGAVCILIIEIAALGQTRPGLVLSAASLLLALGLVCGVAMGIAEVAVARLELGPIPAALARAAAAIPVFVFLSWELFTGGHAQTLPGAAWARVWVPALGYAALAAAIWLGQSLARRRRFRALVAVPVVGLVVIAEVGNRYLFHSEYPDIHAFLVVVSVVGAATAWHLVISARRVLTAAASPTARRRSGVLTALLALAVVAGFLSTLEWGLAAKRDRWVVATHGVHTRQLTRLLRKALDFDGDGYSRFLGGGDCDDGNAHVSPGADDVPGNHIDEDCDGEDEPLPPPSPEPTTPMSYEQALAEWLGAPATRELIARTSKLDILFILLDGVRADMLAPNEEDRRSFPRLSELADESVVFRRAFSPAAGTDVCVTAVLTGHYNPYVRIDTTLTEALYSAGREVHAVFPREVLRWAGKTMLSRGLTGVDELVTDRSKRDVGDHSSSADTSDLGLAFLERHIAAHPEEPFFLWLHYFDVHEHRQMKSSDPRLREMLDDEESPDTRKKYRAIVKIVDGEVGRVIDDLRQRGRWDRTIVVAIADHGESLGEDPRLPDAHGRFVYNPLVHVPLLIRVPGVRPAEIERPVSLVDVTPTLLELAGIALPEGLDGHTLLPYLFDDSPEVLTEHEYPVLLHESEQHGIILWPYKLLIRPAENLVELYDIERDFAEKHDLSDAEPGLVRKLMKLYRASPHLDVVRTREALKRREELAQPPKTAGPAD